MRQLSRTTRKNDNTLNPSESRVVLYILHVSHFYTIRKFVVIHLDILSFDYLCSDVVLSKEV